MDAEPFLQALEDSAPSGAELRNEHAFQAIERSMAPASREARTDKNGEISTTSEVDWENLVADAKELASKGRDLRLLVMVARAWTNLEGFAGLAAGLDLISRSMDDYWESIHPELRDRPKPADAVLGRKNAILQIENDDNGLLGDLEMMSVFNPRGIGPILGEDLASASLSEFDFMNKAPRGLSDQEESDLKARHATMVSRVKTAGRALAAESPDEAQKISVDITAADDARKILEQKFTEHAGLENGAGFRLAKLETYLSQIAATVQSVLAENGDSDTAEDSAMPEATPQTPDTQADPLAESGGSGAPGRINSRREVDACLEKIIDFYARTEPSSPIPHLARRMRRMVQMDFMQLMEEIAPSGMKEFKSVAGVDGKGKSE